MNKKYLWGIAMTVSLGVATGYQYTTSPIQKSASQSTSPLLRADTDSEAETELNDANITDTKSPTNTVTAQFSPRSYIEPDQPELSFVSTKNAQGRIYKDGPRGKKKLALKGADFWFDNTHIPIVKNEGEYVYIQLNNEVSAADAKILADAGITLENYVDSRTWLVHLSNDNIQLLQALPSVYAIGERDIKDKVSPAILKNGVAVMPDEQTYALTVEALDKLDIEQVQDFLLSQNIVTDESIESHSNTAILIHIPKAQFEALLQLNEVAWVENYPAPIETSNAKAAELSTIDHAKNNYGLSGKGIKLGIWDGGNVDDHIDFENRVSNRDDANISTHSTHVAGTMTGNGIGRASAQGMAPNATLQAYDFNNATNEIRAAADNNEIMVSNHSYGSVVGWRYNSSTNAWEFLDNQHLFGQYDSTARAWDDIVADTGSMIVKSAGNDRGNGQGLATAAQPLDGGADGYDSIPTYGGAKNIITVGAVRDDAVITSFSGWGPTDDGRIKPDLVANGLGVESTWLNNGYNSLNGTSMATPVVSGGAALVLERMQQRIGKKLIGASLKATLIHSATDLNAAGPDYDTGWGLLNIQRAIALIDAGASQLFETSLSGSVGSFQEKKFSFVVGGNSNNFKLTIAWSDPMAAANAQNTLVNDINVRLTSPSGTLYYPWIKNPARPAAAATRGVNTRDNVEQIVINNPQAGTWTATINGRINRDQSSETTSSVLTQRVSIASSIPVTALDSDGDGLSDENERAFGLDPFNTDSDNDSLSDYQEVCFDGNCSGYQAFPNGKDTNALKADTDNDGISDSAEVNSSRRSPIINEAAVMISTL